MADTKVYLSGGRIQGASTDEEGAVESLGSAADLDINSGSHPTGKRSNGYSVTSSQYAQAGGSSGSLSQFKFLHEPNCKWSVSFWLKVASSGSGIADGKGIMGTADGATSEIGLSLKMNGTSSLLLHIRGTSGYAARPASNNGCIPSDGNWHHYVMTYDQTLANTNTVLYKDGSAFTMQSTGNKESDGNSTSNHNNPFTIGGADTGEGGSFAFSIDDVSFYDRVLTSAEKVSLYNSGNSIDADDVSVVGLKAFWDMNESGDFINVVPIAKDKSSITDVPVGTRYEETDTRKIFRSYETDADGDWEDGTFGSPWTTDSGDDCTIANGGITVLPNSNDYDGMTFDLQSASGINTTVNSSAWVWQFTIDQIAFSNNGACDYRSGFVMLSSVAGRSGDHVIFHIENTNCGFQASGYRFCIKNSGNHDGGQESESSSRHFKPASNAMITASTTQGSSSDGKIGIRITRTASDAFKFQVYNDPTFAGTPTTDVNTTSTSICGDCTALRYVQVGGYKQGNASGSSEFVIDDMKFWNGVTTPTQTIAWKEKGTA